MAIQPTIRNQNPAINSPPNSPVSGTKRLPMSQRATTVSSFSNIDAIKKDPSINMWVFNMTPEKKGRNHNSNIMFTVQHNNQTSLIQIPRTWVPINIGLMSPKSVLFDNPNFLKSLTQGLLRLITNDEADKFFEENPEAETEYDLVMSRLNNIDMSEVNNDSIDLSNIKEMADGDVEYVADNVSPAVVNIVERFNDKEPDITEAEAFSLIKNIEHSLTSEDLSYISNDIKSEKIQQLINKIRAEQG